MTENEKNGHNRQASYPSENHQLDENAHADQDIIELSDIAVGITPEDDAIVELTEDIIGEAFFGFSKATSDKLETDESELDLSEKRQTDGLTGQPDDVLRQSTASASSVGLTGTSGVETDPQDEDITRQLDNYFGVEEEPLKKYVHEAHPISEPPDDEALPAVASAPPTIQETRSVSEISITASQLDEAIERVIRKLYAEKINRILDTMIERTVTEEIGLLKDYLIGIADKKD